MVAAEHTSSDAPMGGTRFPGELLRIASGRQPLNVKHLWRYPVKSMLGEACASLRVDARGVEGDRLYAVRDAQGKLGSGKNTRRWSRIDGLFDLQATSIDGMPAVRFPDGRKMPASDPGVHAALSAALGQSVTLVRESEPLHFDAAPIHILTTASLAWLRHTIPDVQADERRFRPNLLLEVEGTDPLELQWPGRTLLLGDRLKLRITDTAERCRMVTMGQSELPEDARILREIAQRLDAQFGVYAEVLVPGELRAGDPARLV
jgi:uncharacterized protein